MKDVSIFQPIVIVPIEEVNSKLYKKLYQLNFRSVGTMRGALVRTRRQNNSYVSYILDADNNVAAWTIIFVNHLGRATSYYYVRKKYRRHGLGTQLMKAAVDVANNYFNNEIHYVPHDIVSVSFFRNCRKLGIIRFD